jgi:hypothetical protein
MKSAEAGFARIVSTGRFGWFSCSYFSASVSEEKFQFDCPGSAAYWCVRSGTAFSSAPRQQSGKV